MKRTFVVLNGFWEDWIRLGLTDDNLQKFEEYLMENSTSGDLIRGSNGIKKIRWKLGNKGKSGGVRIFYLDLETKCILFLIALISKNEKENLTKSQISTLADLVNQLKKEG